MADKEDMKRLENGEHDLSQSDFQDADLSKIVLRGRNFTGSQFHRANIEDADLRDCNFWLSVLHDVKASGANLSNSRIASSISVCNFSNSTLTGASLDNSHISKTNFALADIRGASFKNVTFEDGNSFDGTRYDEKTDFTGSKAMRKTARQEVFQYFELVDGVFRRKSDQLANINASQIIEDVTVREDSHSVNEDNNDIIKVDTMSELYRDLEREIKNTIRHVKADNELMSNPEGSQRIAELEAGSRLIAADQADRSLVKRLLIPSLTWFSKKVRDEAAATAIKGLIALVLTWIVTKT